MNQNRFFYALKKAREMKALETSREFRRDLLKNLSFCFDASGGIEALDNALNEASYTGLSGRDAEKLIYERVNEVLEPMKRGITNALTEPRGS